MGIAQIGGSAGAPGRTVTATLTATGTWTVPAGCTQVQAIIIGGGAGGGGGGSGWANYGNSIVAGSGAGGGGGGSSAYARFARLSVTPGQVIPVTIGSGGVGGTGGMWNWTETQRRYTVVAGAAFNYGNVGSVGQTGGDTTFANIVAYGARNPSTSGTGSVGLGGTAPNIINGQTSAGGVPGGTGGSYSLLHVNDQTAAALPAVASSGSGRGGAGGNGGGHTTPSVSAGYIGHWRAGAWFSGATNQTQATAYSYSSDPFWPEDRAAYAVTGAPGQGGGGGALLNATSATAQALYCVGAGGGAGGAIGGISSAALGQAGSYAGTYTATATTAPGIGTAVSIDGGNGYDATAPGGGGGGGGAGGNSIGNNTPGTYAWSGRGGNGGRGGDGVVILTWTE